MVKKKIFKIIFILVVFNSMFLPRKRKVTSKAIHTYMCVYKISEYIYKRTI